MRAFKKRIDQQKTFLIFFKFFLKKHEKTLAFLLWMWYSIKAFDGSLAQLGEHLPYKQRVTGSSPVTSTKKNDKFRQKFVVFLFKPQAWYGITR